MAETHGTIEHIVRWVVIACVIALLLKFLPMWLVAIMLIAWYIHYLVEDSK